MLSVIFSEFNVLVVSTQDPGRGGGVLFWVLFWTRLREVHPDRGVLHATTFFVWRHFCFRLFLAQKITETVCEW